MYYDMTKNLLFVAGQLSAVELVERLSSHHPTLMKMKRGLDGQVVWHLVNVFTFRSNTNEEATVRLCAFLHPSSRVSLISDKYD